MPYAIRRRGSKYIVINTETNEVKGTHTTRAKAEAQRRLLMGIERGWKPQQRKKK